MDTHSIIIALLATFSVATLGILFLEPILSGEARAEKRQVQITGGSARRKAVDEAGNRRRQVADTLKELDERNKAQTKLTLEQRCVQAGVNWTRKTYIMISIFSALGTGMLFLILTGKPLLALGGLLIGGMGLPSWILKRKTKKRQQAFLIEFPNAIEAIVRGIKSGLPLNDCIRLIANEAKDPLKSEFRQIIEAQQMGISLPDAVSKIYDHIPISEVNFFSIVIQIQSKSGGNLGEILLNLSKVIRDRKKLRDKVNAVSQEAKSSAIIIGALPVVVMGLTYLGSPDYIRLLWTTNAGYVALGACASIMLIGSLIMKKMINFEI